MENNGGKMMYGFYDRLKEEFPSQIIVDITQKCNLSCVHCPHSEYVKSNIYRGGEIQFELIQKLAEEVKKHGKGYCQQIRFTAYGEPMLHPDFYEIIGYTVEHSGVFVSVTTNGTLIDDKAVSRLLDTNVSLVDISLDAYSDEVYKKIRRNNHYFKVKNGVMELINENKKRGSRTKIVVSFVKQPLNEMETEKFDDFWKNNGVDYVVIRDLHTAGGAKASNEIIETKEERRPCVYPWERLSIGTEGEITFCPNSWEGKSIIGNYRTDDIHTLWKSTKYKLLREMHLNNNFCEGYACEKCKDWMMTRWPLRGRGYGDMIKDFTKENEK